MLVFSEKYIEGLPLLQQSFRRVRLWRKIHVVPTSREWVRFPHTPATEPQQAMVFILKSMAFLKNNLPKSPIAGCAYLLCPVFLIIIPMIGAGSA